MADAKEKTQSGVDQSLSFERRIIELENHVEQAESDQERQELQQELQREREAVFSNMTAWQRVQLARHALRPRMLDYTNRILDDLVDLHGDRLMGDDPAVVGGIGRFRGQSVMVVGQQKGVTTEEKVACNFGMAHPEGYRKALRLFRLAERWRMPIVTFVDPPAAHPGIEAEARGQGSAIATNLLAMMQLRTPFFTVVIGEGGSGGALGIALGDTVAMMEHAIYVICPPERCAEILWRDVEKKEMAASALRVTADDLYDLGIVDRIIREPSVGAHRDPDAAAESIGEELELFLDHIKNGGWSLESRQEKYRRMGIYSERVTQEL